MMRPQLIEQLRGTFHLSSRVAPSGKEQSILLGRLRVFPTNLDPAAGAGQWALTIQTDDVGDARARLFIDVGSRLGLLPVNFTKRFIRALRSDTAMCLVGDTNSLMHGTLAQALAVRDDRATYVAIADQVMMELQKRREGAYTKPARVVDPPPAEQNPPPVLSAVDVWKRACIRERSISIGGRALARIKRGGHLVHVVYPPEPMVRYFGGSQDDEETEHTEFDGEIGSNAIRDRLILEATRQQRVLLPGVPVWLVTGDANLAAHAKTEGFDVGFGWLANNINPPVLTSPVINPRTLELYHVGIDELLEELVWSCGSVALQREYEGQLLIARLPSGRRDRMLTEIGEPGYAIKWQRLLNKPFPVGSTDARAGTAVSKKAPPPQTLINELIRAAGLTPPTAAEEASNTAKHYLQALGWLLPKTGALTSRGTELVARWRAIGRGDFGALAKWLEDAGNDVTTRIPWATAVMIAVKGEPGIADKKLAAITGDATRTVESQLVFLNAFGLMVRLGDKSRTSVPRSAPEAHDAIKDAVGALLVEKARRPTESEAVGSVFVFLTRPQNQPMSFPKFRSTLLEMHNEGKALLSGSAPGVNVRVRAVDLSDDGYAQAVDFNLGEGTILGPGTPANAIAIQNGDP